MTDGDLLLRAVLNDPEDDTARLVYADWLIEHGDRKRGEFIRGQVEAASAGIECPREIWDLLPAGFEWLGLQPPEEFEIGWDRGFVDWIVSPRRYIWNRKRLQKLFSQHPINSVELCDVSPAFLDPADPEQCGWWPGGWTVDGKVSDLLFARLPDGEMFFCCDAGEWTGWFLQYPTWDSAREALRAAVTSYGRSLVRLPSSAFRQKEGGRIRKRKFVT
ncbi:hypothetical protein GobsT_41090 [Gemmata obscuriglobus]|uniref:TIGR02996 domain-containing protein n=1 Tax=Gemmata obscuriglobus TaxID=114 RepID=A0A2Z3GVV0_9BACT|nr:TIGR02996 domain-containing protein [Gemmata obscuriglobus]AWM37853.1 TIGR02996 domain-containing protein [Gemmata obscuriglobus]QEG29314.1 hypothetical protein GobsT_41090 [Gemmata obscuriglobus]VTS08301.1 Uncharacterized protein OS=Sorangium cellulosum (strain So ce56) GN=sce1195 PE=4 SV=1 [Gemmata obscuriglobus UQM 2246]